MYSIKINDDEFKFDFKEMFYYIMDLGNIEGIQTTSSAINQDGLTLENVNYSSRSIMIEGLFKSNPKRVEEVRKKLSHLINPKIPIEVIKNDKKIIAFPKTTLNISRESKWNNDYFFKFLIEATAFDPFFYNKKDDYILTQGYEDLFEFPLEIKEEGIEFARKRPALTTVTNNGDVPTGCIFEYYFIAETTNPKIINASTREFIKINSSFNQGDKLIIDTNYSKKKITLIREGKEYNYIKHLDYRSSFLQLEVGLNKFKFEVETGENSFQSAILFSERWFEA